MLLELFVLRDQNIANQVGIIYQKDVLASHLPVDDVAELRGRFLQETDWILAKLQEYAAGVTRFGAEWEPCHNVKSCDF